MPTTSSPWASPSSPAGRRLLLTEPSTLDAIPVLDDATLALGAALVAASATTDPTPAPRIASASAAHRPASTAASARSSVPSRSHRGRPAVRRGMVAAALAVGLLAVGAAPVLDRPAPALSASAPVASHALGRAAGVAVGTSGPVAPGPLADGQVVVGLVDPTETLRATPAGAPPSLGGRLGTLVALAAEEQSAG